MTSHAFTPQKRKVAVYVRVSTTEQKLDGYGTEAQKQHILSYIQNNPALGLMTEGAETEWYFEDTHTGAEILRPALQMMLKKAIQEKQFDTIIVWKIDRLSRSLKDLLEIFEMLQQHNIGLLSIQENIDFRGAIGTLIFQVFGAIAQFERSLIQNRTRGGIIASASMGNYTGTAVPYGYKAVKNENGRGKKLVLIPEEKAWVEKIFHWYIYENMGYRTIATKLTDLQVPRGMNEQKPRSKKWTEYVIEKIIKNPLYRGEYVAVKKDANGITLPKEQWVTVAIPPCVSEVVFAIAQQKRQERTGKHASKYVYPLAGLLKDMTTWKPFTFKGKPNTKNSGRSYNRSKLQHPITGAVYPNFSLPAHTVEKHIWERILSAFKDPDSFIKKHLHKREQGNGYTEQLEQEIRTAREQQQQLHTQLMRIEHAYEQGEYPLEKMREKKESLNDELVAIEQRIESLTAEVEAVALSEQHAAGLRSAAEQFNGKLDTLTETQKKVFMQFFVERVEVRREAVIGKIRMRPILTVFFRFLPECAPPLPSEGRTQEAHQKKHESLSDSKIVNHGGEADTRYTPIRYIFTLEYYKEIQTLRGRKRAVLFTRGVEYAKAT